MFFGEVSFLRYIETKKYIFSLLVRYLRQLKARKQSILRFLVFGAKQKCCFGAFGFRFLSKANSFLLLRLSILEQKQNVFG